MAASLSPWMLAALLGFSLLFSMGASSIDCFKCVSVNGDNPACEDPFHNNHSLKLLESPCMGGRKGRDGVFPATACIKMSGRYTDSDENITVRGCALDSGTLTTDTEIIRMSHCGAFYYENRYIRGCVQSCDDSDGCNASARPALGASTMALCAVAALTRLPAPCGGKYLN